MLFVPESTSALIPNCPNVMCGDAVVEPREAEEKSPDTVALVELGPMAMRVWFSYQLLNRARRAKVPIARLSDEARNKERGCKGADHNKCGQQLQ